MKGKIMRKINPVKTVAMGIRIPVELKEKLEIIARNEVRTLSHQIVYFLERAIREVHSTSQPEFLALSQQHLSEEKK